MDLNNEADRVRLVRALMGALRVLNVNPNFSPAASDLESLREAARDYPDGIGGLIAQGVDEYRRLGVVVNSEAIHRLNELLA